MTTFATTLVVAVLATAWAVASPLGMPCASAVSLGSASASPSESASFVSAINQLRASHGLNHLSVDGNLTQVAQDWAMHMAEENSISHRLDLRAGITALWKAIGENVGVGPNVQELMSAFVASPGHYKNLVDPRFTHIGVGTVRTSGGLIYTAHEFMAVEGSTPAVTSAPTPAAPPVTRAAPRVTTPRVTTPVTAAPPTTVTTVPETTTTTMLVLPTEQYKLQDGGEDDHQKQKSKSNGRCRSHTSPRLMALSAVI